jgi:hypothetical protein
MGAGALLAPAGATADSCVGQPGCPYTSVASVLSTPFPAGPVAASSKGPVVAMAPNEVIAFSPSGDIQGAWNPPDPASRSIAIDPAGAGLNITNTNLGSVATFLPDGAFLGNFSSKGSGPGQLIGPDAIARDAKNNVYVGDTAHGVQKFNAKRKVVAVANAPPGVTSMALDGSASIVLAAATPSVPSVTRYTSALAPVGSFALPGAIENPQIAVDAIGDIYVSDPLADVVYQYSGAGDLLSTFGGLGGTLGSFKQPAGVTVDGSDNLYVGDSGNARVQRFALIDAAAATLAESATAISAARGRGSGTAAAAAIKVHCEVRGLPDCTGTLSVRLAGQSAGTGTFTIKDGRTEAVPVRLSSAAKRRLAKRRNAAVQVEIRTRTRDAARPRVVRRPHTLRAGG